MDSTTCTEKKGKTITFNSFVEYADYAIELNKKRIEKEQKEYRQFLISIMNIGIKHGLLQGTELNEAYRERKEEGLELTEEERISVAKEFYGRAIDDSTEELNRFFEEQEKTQKKVN